MKKSLMFLIVVMTAIVSSILALTVCAEIPKEKIDALSESEKTSLSSSVQIAILTRKAGINRSKYSDILGEDLADYSLEELEEIQKCLSGESNKDDHHIDVSVTNEPFKSELNASFSLYETIADAGRQLGYVTQNNNPEISFGDDLQSVSFMRIYVSYYGECTKEEAKETLEGYTDELIYAITKTYPDVVFETLNICWEVSAIEEDNLYAATYWCENTDGELTRGGGKGIIYN